MVTPATRGGAARPEAAVRAVRGATTVARDDAALLHEATAELLVAMLERNDLCAGDLVSAIFTVTPDLASAFPACAARALGWHDVPLLCAQEIAVPRSLPRCIRVLLHAHARRDRSAIRHVYLRDAVGLRPDLGTLVAAAALEPSATAPGAARDRR